MGASRAAEGLRATLRAHLATVHAELGTLYVRFHGLFHDEMFVYREVDGHPVLNFQYVDALVDRMLELGVRPFVELGFMPSDLATATDTVIWWHGNGAPPQAYHVNDPPPHLPGVNFVEPLIHPRLSHGIMAGTPLGPQRCSRPC